MELIPEEVLIAVLAECVPEHVRRDARVGDIGETIIRVFMLHLRAEAASGGSPAVLGSLLAGACTSKTLRPKVKSLPGAAMGRTPPLLLQRNSTSPKGRKPTRNRHGRRASRYPSVSAVSGPPSSSIRSCESRGHRGRQRDGSATSPYSRVIPQALSRA